MTVTINGTTGIDKVQDGSIQAADLASGVPSRSQLPAGTVLQVVNFTSSTQVTSTTATFVDTGLTATITPTSASSKILIFTSINGVYHGNSTACFGAQLVRNSTPICVFEAILGNSNSSQMGSASSMNYLDAPATTSAITYKVQFNNPNASATTYINLPNAGLVSTSALTLMEIAA